MAFVNGPPRRRFMIPPTPDSTRRMNTVRTAAPGLHLLEQMIKGAAYLEFFLAALHMHDLMATQAAADMLDCIDANHGSAMDLPEFFRVQLIDELLDRLAYQGLETLGLD